MADKPRFPDNLHVVPEDNSVIDLDRYRERRIQAGTWPLSREEMYRFWYQWREDRRRGR